MPKCLSKRLFRQPTRGLLSPALQAALKTSAYKVPPQETSDPTSPLLRRPSWMPSQTCGFLDTSQFENLSLKLSSGHAESHVPRTCQIIPNSGPILSKMDTLTLLLSKVLFTHPSHLGSNAKVPVKILLIPFLSAQKPWSLSLCYGPCCISLCLKSGCSEVSFLKVGTVSFMSNTPKSRTLC